LWRVGRQNADNADSAFQVSYKNALYKSTVINAATLYVRDDTMAITFWFSMVYNFGYVIAIGTIFDSRGEFLELNLSDEDIASHFEVLRDVAMAINFGTKSATAGFV